MTDYINHLLGTGDSYTTDPDKPLAIEAVIQDAMDQRAFQSVCREAPALEDLIYDLNGQFPYTRELVGDVYQLFFKADPQIRTREQMDPRFLQSQAVATDIDEAPDTPLTRTLTRHDIYGSAMATLAVSNEIRDALDRFKEAQAAAEEAEKQREELRDAIKELASALRQLRQEIAERLAEDGMLAMQAMGPLLDDNGAPIPGSEDDLVPSFQGPLTEAQDAICVLVAAGIGEAEGQQQEFSQAMAEAQHEADKTGKAVREDIEEAISNIHEDLREEQSLFASWGLEEGEVKKMSFKERAELAQKLRSSKFHKYLDQLGRWKLMIASQSVRKTEYGRDEVIGVELSGDIERILGSEIAAGRHPALKMDFLEKLDSHTALSRKYQGVEKIGKGAIVMVIDESGSMNELGPALGNKGERVTREFFAKGFALALLDYCRQKKRDFVAVVFSSPNQQKVYRFPKGEGDISDVLMFVEHFFSGGTWVETPMNMAVDILEEEFSQHGRAKGDVIFVTDDDVRVSHEWMHEYKERKTRLDFRTWGIAVGHHANNVLEAVSDNTRSVTAFFDPDQVADIVRVLD